MFHCARWRTPPPLNFFGKNNIWTKSIDTNTCSSIHLVNPLLIWCLNFFFYFFFFSSFQRNPIIRRRCYRQYHYNYYHLERVLIEVINLWINLMRLEIFWSPFASVCVIRLIVRWYSFVSKHLPTNARWFILSTWYLHFHRGHNREHI